MAEKVNAIKRAVVLIFFAMLVSTVTAEDKVIYVDADAVGANNGSNWENAYLCLQDALEDVRDDFLEDANDGAPIETQTDYEVRVANGIYKPDRRTSEGSDGRPLITASGDWTDTFWIRNLTIKGGYAGYGEPDPNARDINLYETILSGDLYGNDVDVSNPEDLREDPSRAENSFHVVISAGHSVIDGFIITGGNANDPSHSHNDNGGGLRIYGRREITQITNCTFTGNSALSRGGGIYAYGSSLILTNCTFTENQAGSSGGGGIYAQHGDLILTNCTFAGNQSGSGDGGGINGYNCTLDLTNCTFIENSTYGEGGGIATEQNYPNIKNCTFIENSARAGGGLYNNTSNPILTNCVFRGNSVNDQGGGMCNILKSRSGNSPILRNCLFTGNNSGFRGGGIYNLSCEPVLTNCTFAGNWAGEGNALYCKSEHERNTVTLTNCILWDFGTEIWSNDLSIINIFYSNIKGGWFGEGNIDEYPQFADPNGPDRKPGTEDDDLRLIPLSPCVDSGDPLFVSKPNETDIDGNPRIVGGRVDMGAYESQYIIYVDDDAPWDPGPGGILVSDPLENGSESHPMDSIQEAIDLAKDGYTVLVRGGIYSEPIDFKGKAITVTSGSDVAVLETPGDYAVSFLSAEGPDSILKNFVIRNSLAGVFIPGSSPTIRNLTAVDNEYGVTAYTWAEPDISNCIFWNNSEADLFQCEARYSCIEDRGQGQGNIRADPLFVDAENGDYHLRSEGWCWSTKTKSWTYDYVTSPCIDAGDPRSPLGNEPLSAPRDPDNEYGINLRINMGAYGGTCQASIPPLNWIPEFDTDPPVPNPTQWVLNGEPRVSINGIEMTAAEATDASGPVEYFFECTTDARLSSKWQISCYYLFPIGRSGRGQRFRVKARDQFGNETAWSDELSAE